MTLFVYVQEALLTVSARVPDTEQYRDFSDEVKRIAREEFNYTYDEDPVDPFVAAFHEAVLLYAIVSHPGSPRRQAAIRPSIFVLISTLYIYMIQSCFCFVYKSALFDIIQALNETLAAGGDVSNGTAITSRMWGRTFVGTFVNH
jgi:hypothetical protein